jgi:hypothetical protein
MTVEAPQQSRTIRRSAMRQVHQPVAIAVLDPQGMAPVIAAVIDQVRRIHKDRWCGSFVFIDTALNVYVIAEERTVALDWVRTRFRDLVGKYQTSARGNDAEPWLSPTPDGLAEDFTDHLRQLGVVT